MERGYLYDVMFIYNQPEIRIDRHRNEDHRLSLKIVKYAISKTDSWNLRSFYSDRDSMPGSNLFGEFFTAVKASRYVVIVITRGFINDCWCRYKSQAAFIRLMKEESNRFIALRIDLNQIHIPDEFITVSPLDFSDNWRDEEEIWTILKNRLTSSGINPIVTDTRSDLHPLEHVEQRDNASALLTSGGRYLTRPFQQYNTSGIHTQETNPPGWPRIDTDNSIEPDGPSSPSDQSDRQGQSTSVADNQTGSLALFDSDDMSNARTCRLPPDGAQAEQQFTGNPRQTGQGQQLAGNKRQNSQTEVKEVIGNHNSGGVTYSSLDGSDIEIDNNQYSSSSESKNSDEKAEKSSQDGIELNRPDSRPNNSMKESSVSLVEQVRPVLRGLMYVVQRLSRR